MDATAQLSFLRDMRTELKAANASRRGDPSQCFPGFPAAHYALGAGMEGASFGAGEVVFRAAELQQRPILLLSGRAQLIVTDEAGDQPRELFCPRSALASG